MTLAEQYAQIDQLLADNIAGGIDAPKLRTILKTVAAQLRIDAASITAWSPVLAPILNGPYVVVQIIDWINGQGTKPPIGGYLSAQGITADINMAADFRGSVGAQGLPGNGLLTTITAPGDNLGTPRWYPILELAAPSAGTYDFADIEITCKPWDNTSGGHGHMKMYVANRGTFKYEFTTQGSIDGFSVEVRRISARNDTAIVYLKADQNFRSLSVRVPSYSQAVVYGSLQSVSTQPTGTLVLDTSSPTYQPIMALTPGSDIIAINSVVMQNNISPRKAVLYNVANNDHQFYGLGVLGSMLRYQVPSSTDSHVFSAGATAASSLEIMRMQGNGNVGVGMPQPNFRLDVGASNPANGVVQQIINTSNGTLTGATGTMLQVHQGGIAIWRHGLPAGQSAYAFYAFRGGTFPEVARFTDSGKLLVGRTAENDRDILQLEGSIIAKCNVQNYNPTSGEVPDGFWRVVRNGNDVRLWANVGGTMKSVALA